MSLREKLRIMVVDDMSTSRGIITQALDSMGILNVLSAPDGPTALKSIEACPVHLVISDYNMPEMSGLHLLHALRSNARTANIGFVLITGRTDRQIVEHGRRLGMNNLIKKPFQPNELKNSIEAIVGRL